MPERATSARERRLVIERAGGRCEYCLSPFAYCPDPFAVEHIVPRSRGGSHRPLNLAYSCQGCNSYKYTSTGAVDPVSGERVPLYHPRQHAWRDHFAWNEDFTEIVGVTPTGRATIVCLDLNRPNVVNLRRLLAGVNQHPPKETLPQEL
jgi:5-methylcytosine-specific restriction endonuclease McrA